jgi:hypothetical protein
MTSSIRPGELPGEPGVEFGEGLIFVYEDVARWAILLASAYPAVADEVWSPTTEGGEDLTEDCGCGFAPRWLG